MSESKYNSLKWISTLTCSYMKSFSQGKHFSVISDQYCIIHKNSSFDNGAAKNNNNNESPLKGRKQLIKEKNMKAI